MKYAEARGVIRSGDVLAWSHRGLKSWYDLKIQFVRFVTQSEFSHVGVALVLGGRVWVVEAVMPHVRVFPLSRLTPFYWLPMDAEWKPEAEEFALSTIGAKYSQWQAIKAFFRYTDADGLWQCAALVNAIQKANGVELKPEKETPSAIVYAAQERDGAITTLVT